jgi:hypothetical protein
MRGKGVFRFREISHLATIITKADSILGCPKGYISRYPIRSYVLAVYFDISKGDGFVGVYFILGELIWPGTFNEIYLLVTHIDTIIYRPKEIDTRGEEFVSHTGIVVIAERVGYIEDFVTGDIETSPVVFDKLAGREWEFKTGEGIGERVANQCLRVAYLLLVGVIDSIIPWSVGYTVPKGEIGPNSGENVAGRHLVEGSAVNIEAYLTIRPHGMDIRTGASSCIATPGRDLVGVIDLHIIRLLERVSEFVVPDGDGK